MGFGIMFRLDEESAKRHSAERKMRVYDDLESVSSAVMDRFEKYSINFEEEVLEAVQEEQDEEDEGKEHNEANIVSGYIETSEVVTDVELNEAPETSMPDKELENAAVEDEKQQALDDECCEEDKSSLKLGRLGSNIRSSSPTSTVQSNTNRSKKKLSKKKARRYAEQDEEDVELAMMVLGHASKKSGKTMHDLKEEKTEHKKKQDLKAKQSKAGLNLIKVDWVQAMEQLDCEVQLEMKELVSLHAIDEGEIDLDLIKDLALYPANAAIAIIHEFRDSKNLAKTANKSNLFAGIMRTFKKNMNKSKAVAVITLDASDFDAIDATDENDDDHAINRNDGDFLTECPLSDDKILFAVPVCSPYMSMQRFKYKVKLTPGTLKKGKAVKQILELLPKVREASEIER
eukprot:gene45346-55482_t